MKCWLKVLLVIACWLFELSVAGGANADISYIVTTLGSNFGVLRNSLRALSEDISSSTSEDIISEVIIIYTAPRLPSLQVRDAITSSISRTLPSARLIIPETPILTTSQAINAAISSTTEGTIVVLLDESIEVQPGFTSSASSHVKLARKESISGCVLLSEDSETVYDVGIDFALTRLTGVSPLVYSPIGYNANNQQSLPSNVPAPYHKFQGHSLKHPSVQKLMNNELLLPETPFVLGHECTIIPPKARQILGAFDNSFGDDFFIADYSLRARNNSIAIDLCKDCLGIHFSDASPSYSSSDDSNEETISESAIKPFLERWLSTIQPRMTEKRRVLNSTIIWSMDCGAGQTLGFTTEAINFAIALEDYISFRVELKNKQQCRDELRKAGWPSCIIKDIMRLASLETEFKDNSVLIVHKDPGRYRSFVTERWGEPTPIHVVGRSMFETDNIPSDWIQNCNEGVVQRIWVPSSFNIETFSHAGVNRSLLYQLPEAVDTDLFSPDNKYPPLELPKRNSAEFVFLSVSKWEPRKGLNKLIEAYIQEFSASDQVSLFIRSNVDEGNIKDFNEIVKKAAKEKLDGLQASEGIPDSLPRLLPWLIPLHKMPSLYSSANCFILPSCGEGWGLPIIEAMASGIPVIATNWSGSTEFLKEDNSFLIHVDTLSDVPGLIGHKWADPSIPRIRSLMRSVYESKAEARRRAEKARELVSDHFSHAAIREIFFTRLNELSSLPHYVQPAYQPPTYTYTPPSSTLSRPTRIKIN